MFHNYCTFASQSRSFLSQLLGTGDESGFFYAFLQRYDFQWISPSFLLHYSLSCIFTSLGRICGAPSALAWISPSFLLHYSLSCIFTSLGRICGAPSALAYRKAPFSHSVKEHTSRVRSRSCTKMAAMFAMTAIIW